MTGLACYAFLQAVSSRCSQVGVTECLSQSECVTDVVLILRGLDLSGVPPASCIPVVIRCSVYVLAGCVPSHGAVLTFSEINTLKAETAREEEERIGLGEGCCMTREFTIFI